MRLAGRRVSARGRMRATVTPIKDVPVTYSRRINRSPLMSTMGTEETSSNVVFQQPARSQGCTRSSDVSFLAKTIAGVGTVDAEVASATLTPR